MNFKSILLAFTLMMISFVLFGQQNSVEESNQKTTLKSENRMSAAKTKGRQNMDDGYMGKKQTILRKLTVNEIPEDFPKYDKSMTKEEYAIVIKKWCKEHIDLVKDEFKNELK